MSYERLELTDFVDKWDAIKVKHLEDGIVANEEAIKRYHNDSIIEMQADWTQNDPTAKDYVKNRTHYKETETYSIVNNFEITYNERHYEEGEHRYLEPNNFSCDLSMEGKEPTSLKVFVNGEPIKVVDYDGDANWKRWDLENNLRIGCSSRGPKGESSEPQLSWGVSLINGFEAVDGQKFNLTITIDGVTYIPIDEKYMPKSVLEWQQPVDWNCNDVNDPTYIKNRTHYDYWDQGKKIYDYYDFENEGTLPYTFQVTKEGKGWLGGHGFMYNGCLFNGDSNWENIGEEYDETLEAWKIKYKCQQTQIYYGEEETLTINAATYSQYIPEKDERGSFVTIDCEYEGYRGIRLYEAEMRSKTLDKRFLADFSVEKDWNINDSTDPRYINNRTHYQYLDYTKRLYWEDPILLGHISKLPYTETIRSQINSDEAPGYWLGENKYLLNDYVVDAYSNWEAIPEESADNYTVYRYTIRINEDVRYSVTAKVVYNGWGNDSYITWLSVSGGDGDDKFGKADIHYKQLDPGYLPNGVAQNPDWNEGDDNSPSYIDNKPFYEYQEKRILIYEGTIPSESYSVQEPIVTGGKYLVTVNGVSEKVSSWYEYEGDWEWRGFSTSQLRVSTHNFQGKLWAGSTDFYAQGDLAVPYTVSIEKIIVDNELKQLDEKFIPDTIARVADIPIILDTTLTKEGAAADAKVVGEAISKLTNDLESLTWSDLGEHVISEDRVEIIEIDEKYIPEVIARTSDLTNLDTKVTGDLEALENKVDNKQIEDYFEQVNERLLLSNNEYGRHEGTFYLNDGDTFSDYPITLKIVRKSDNATLIFKEDDDDITIINMAMITDGMTSPKLDSIGIFAIKIDRTFNAIQIYLHSPDNVYDFYEWELSSIKTLDEKYISDSIARAPKATLDYVTETPTAEQYNALLDILKQAGILI